MFRQQLFANNLAPRIYGIDAIAFFQFVVSVLLLVRNCAMDGPFKRENNKIIIKYFSSIFVLINFSASKFKISINFFGGKRSSIENFKICFN